MVRASVRRAFRAIRGASAPVMAFGLLLAFIVGLVRGGSHYLYCPFMDVVVAEHCCADARGALPSAQTPDCCELRTIGALPTSARVPTARAIPVAPVVAMLPAVRDLTRSVVARPSSSTSVRQTGPPPLEGTRRAARLMVFLI
jgi:hypothetical protein